MRVSSSKIELGIIKCCFHAADWQHHEHPPPLLMGAAHFYWRESMQFSLWDKLNKACQPYSSCSATSWARFIHYKVTFFVATNEDSCQISSRTKLEQKTKWQIFTKVFCLWLLLEVIFRLNNCTREQWYWLKNKYKTALQSFRDSNATCATSSERASATSATRRTARAKKTRPYTWGHSRSRTWWVGAMGFSSRQSCTWMKPQVRANAATRPPPSWAITTQARMSTPRGAFAKTSATEALQSILTS